MSDRKVISRKGPKAQRKGYEGYGSGMCRYCGQMLATPHARQCFSCGYDWHDSEHVVQRGDAASRRKPDFPKRRSRGFLRLFVMCIAAQLLVAAVILLLIQLPLMLILSVAIAAPMLSFFLHQSTTARRDGETEGTSWTWWGSALRKILALVFSALCLARPDWMAIVALVAFGVVCGYWFVVRLWRRRSPTPLDMVMFLAPIVVFAATWLHNPQTAVRTVVLTLGAAELIDLMLTFRDEIRRWRGRR